MRMQVVFHSEIPEMPESSASFHRRLPILLRKTTVLFVGLVVRKINFTGDPYAPAFISFLYIVYIIKTFQTLEALTPCFSIVRRTATDVASNRDRKLPSWSYNFSTHFKYLCALLLFSFPVTSLIITGCE